VKVGDIVRLSSGSKLEKSWRGIIVRRIHRDDEDLVVHYASLSDYGEFTAEWYVHWIHHPPSEMCLEYEIDLEVVSESR